MKTEDVATPSEVAVAISEAIDSTSNHAELIDRVIAEHANIVCSFCGVSTFKGAALDEGKRSDECRKALTDHMLTCEQRPEKKLLDERDSNLATISAQRDAMEGLLKLIEDGDLVRDITKADDFVYFAHQGVRITNAIGTTRAALGLARKLETE